MDRWTPKYGKRMNSHRLRLSYHAAQRIDQRGLTPRQVAQVLKRGEWEWEYGNIIRYGFSPRLLTPRQLRWARRKRLLNVVVLVDRRSGKIVTVYREDPDLGHLNTHFPRDVRPPSDDWYTGPKQ